MTGGSLVRHLATTLYDVRRQVHPGTRSAWNHYAAGRMARKNSARLEGAARDDLILTSLRSAVRRAARLPFWSDRFEAAAFPWESDFTFADYAALPPFERTDIAELGAALLDPVVSAAQRRKMATGGSSGSPTVTWTGPEERGWIESGIEYFQREIGWRDGESSAYLWGHHLDPVQRASPRERIEDWMLNRRWYDCFRLSPDILAAYHADLLDFRPRVMVAYASALYSLAEAIRDLRLPPPNYPGLAFITGAEKLYPSQRALIESVFSKPVYERYGGRDIGLVGAQSPRMPAHAFAVDWTNVYVERETHDDVSSLLVTKLHADAMPMLRYRTGDMGRFDVGTAYPGPCVTIVEVVGREMQRIWGVDGTWMHGTVVPHLLKDFSIREYQLRQDANYDVELLIVPEPSYDESEHGAIMSAMTMNLPRTTFSIRQVAGIERTAAGKWLPVVSDVDPALAAERARTAHGGG